MDIDIHPAIAIPLLIAIVIIVAVGINGLENDSSELPKELKLRSKPPGARWITCKFSPVIFGQQHKVSSFKYFEDRSGLYLKREGTFRSNGCFFFSKIHYSIQLKGDVLVIDRRQVPPRREERGQG